MTLTRGPDFIIAGGHKCATTTLHAMLERNPRLSLSTQKEPHFLARGSLGTRLSNVVDERDAYESLWPLGDTRPRGEASALYLTFAQEVVERIEAECDRAPQVVISLRSPIERARSSYLDVRLKNPAESAPSFDAMVQRELERGPWRLDGDGSPTLRHLALGQYSRGITTFLRSLGESNVLLINFDEVGRDPQGAVGAIESFIGVPSTSTSTPSSGVAHNAGGLVWRSRTVDKAMRNRVTVRLRRALKEHAPSVHRRMTTRASQVLATRAPTMDSATFARLADLYAPEVARLESITGWSLGHWLTQE